MLTIRHSPQKWFLSDQNNSKKKPSLSRTPSTQNPDNSSSSAAAAGRIRRLVLTGQDRTKLNKSADREFYAYPRFVTHVDDKFISQLTDLYRQILRPEMEILDLMSSWVSHLPPELKYEKVVGHGLNAEELARNPRLDYFFVKDLNVEQQLHMEDACFDAVLCTVSVQYLQQPEKVSVLLILLRIYICRFLLRSHNCFSNLKLIKAYL